MSNTCENVICNEYALKHAKYAKYVNKNVIGIICTPHFADVAVVLHMIPDHDWLSWWLFEKINSNNPEHFGFKLLIRPGAWFCFFTCHDDFVVSWFCYYDIIFQVVMWLYSPQDSDASASKSPRRRACHCFLLRAAAQLPLAASPLAYCPTWTWRPLAAAGGRRPSHGTASGPGRPEPTGPPGPGRAWG